MGMKSVLVAKDLLNLKRWIMLNQRENLYTESCWEKRPCLGLSQHHDSSCQPFQDMLINIDEWNDEFWGSHINLWHFFHVLKFYKEMTRHDSDWIVQQHWQDLHAASFTLWCKETYSRCLCTLKTKSWNFNTVEKHWHVFKLSSQNLDTILGCALIRSEKKSGTPTNA